MVRFFSYPRICRGLFFLTFLIQRISFSRVVHETEGFQDQKIKLSSEEEGEYLKNQSKSWVNCPYFLIDKTEADAKVNLRNWNGKKEGSSDEYCSNALSELVETPDVVEISKRLAHHPMTSLGDSGKTLSENCINSVKDPERRKLLVAEYHSNMARLKVASLASLESMTAIDSLLGKSSLKDVDCDKDDMSHVLEGCQKLKACQPQGGLDIQASELQAVYPQYLALKKEVSDLRSANALSSMSMGPVYVPNPTQILASTDREKKAVEYEAKIKALESIYPLLGGKVFNQTIDLSKKNFKEAIQQQLKKSREKILEQFKNYHQGVQCMNGVGGCSNFDDLLKKTPSLHIEDFKSGESLSREDGQIQAYLGAVECRQKIREVKQSQDEAIGDFAVGTALTVLTFGVSSYASYTRAAASSIKTSILLPSVADKGAIIDAAVKLSHKARFASRSILGLDLYTLGKNGVDAYGHCSKELNQLSNQRFKKSNSKFDVSCPTEFTQASSQPQLIANYRSCVAKSIVAGVAGIMLPPEVRESIEGPFKGFIGILKKSTVTYTKENEKEIEKKKEEQIKEEEKSSSKSE